MAREKLEFGRYDYAAFSAFTMYSVVSLAIPIMIVSIGKSLNFPIDDGGMGYGGLLHMVRSAAMIVTLLICGFVAARFGKRYTMTASVLMMGGGILCCAFAPAYWVLLPCLMIAGLGEGLCEGIATPFVQDLHPKAPERYVNIAHSFWSVGILLAVLLVGGRITLGINWRIILGVAGFLTVMTALGFCWKENPAKKYPEITEEINSKDILRYSKEIFTKKRFWLCSAAMFFGAGAEFGLTFWATAYVELTFKTSVFVASLGTGAIALGMFIGRTGFGYIAKPQNLRYILLFCGLGMIPISLALAFLEPGIIPAWLLFPLLFVLLFLSGIGIAPYWPTMQVYGVTRLPQCDSTMLYVYYSGMGIPGAGFFSWFMGAMGDCFGLRGAILVVPCCLVIFCSIVLWECWFRAKEEA